MIDLIKSHLNDTKTRRALKDAFEDVLFSLENGDLIDLFETVKHLIQKYTEHPKEVPIIPGTLVLKLIFSRFICGYLSMIHEDECCFLPEGLLLCVG